MKKIYLFLIATVVITLLVLLFSFINRDRMMDRIIEMALTQNVTKTEYLENRDGIRVITLGTSSPIPNERNQTGTAVFVGGYFFLFDVGYGVIRQAEIENLPVDQLSGVFISHWHSDHFIDLPYAINRSWQLGRNKPLDVYGPQGLDTVLYGIEKFLKYEDQHRITHHGEEVMNPHHSIVNPRIIDLSQSSAAVIFQQNDLKISAFLVCHEPIAPSYGFRIDYKGKSVAISGDTRENCRILADQIQDVDLLLHEAMLKDVFVKGSEILTKNGNSRNAKILEDIIEYHTTPLEIGKMASEAGVKKVVLHHFAPVPDNLIMERRYKSDLGKHYKGPISLAQDGDEYYVSIK
tara:strand:+ start:6236 stop:7282 length:1047 start_codon:yes stop_codon:yes gene_type:complete